MAFENDTAQRPFKFDVGRGAWKHGSAFRYVIRRQRYAPRAEHTRVDLCVSVEAIDEIEENTFAHVAERRVHDLKILVLMLSSDVEHCPYLSNFPPAGIFAVNMAFAENHALLFHMNSHIGNKKHPVERLLY